jgi:uncharacterized protein (DUF433 family)
MIERNQWSQHPLIAEYDDINGGYPVLAMTRIGVRLIVQAFQACNDLNGTIEAFPQLRPEQVEAALAYYKQYPLRVDEDIERNVKALEALRTR